MDDEMIASTGASIAATSDFINSTFSASTGREGPTCPQYLEARRFIQKLLIPFPIFTIFGLSFVLRRKKRCQGCCWGRPGFAQPLNFIDEIGRRWAYSACFVVITNDIFSTFDGNSYWGFLAEMSGYRWVYVFTKLADVLTICLCYYPLLTCIDHRYSIASNVVGILYLIPWMLLDSLFFTLCVHDEQTAEVRPMEMAVETFIYVGYFVVGLSYILDLIRNIRRKLRKRKRGIINKSAAESRERIRGYKISHHFLHVGSLLLKQKKEEKVEAKNALQRLMGKLIQRCTYEKKLGFKYSTRLICSMTVAVTMMIWIILRSGLKVDTEFEDITLMCDNYATAIRYLEMYCDYLFVAKVLFHVANVLSGLVVIIYLINSLVTYKRRWHQLLRGDHSWHMYGSTITSPNTTLLNGMKYAGYQVAYAFWGWAVLLVVIWITSMAVTFGIIIPLILGENSWLINKLITWWPTLLLGIIIIPLIQKLICRFLFLQDKGTWMAIDNRRCYNSASYYFFVLNIIVGFFSCMKRILVPCFLGALFLSRLDQPLIMSGFEKLDPGYASFVSMLIVELYHNHPVVKVFVELLYRVREKRHLLSESGEISEQGRDEKLHRSRLARNRWLKAITLVNNPCLALKAIEERLKDEFKQATDEITKVQISDPADALILSMEMQVLLAKDNKGEDGSNL